MEELEGLSIEELIRVKKIITDIIYDFKKRICLLAERIARVIINKREIMLKIKIDNYMDSYTLRIVPYNKEYAKILEPVFRSLFKEVYLSTFRDPSDLLQSGDLLLEINFTVLIEEKEKLLRSLMAMDDKELALWLKLECGG